MIAPAMNTGPEDRLLYRELARQRARIQRSIDLQYFSRLQSFVDADSERNPCVAVDLAFHVDSEGLPWVTGTAQVELDLLCLRCVEVVDHPLKTALSLCIVIEDETDAAVLSELAENRDLLSVTSTSVTLSEVVEDELLLAMPERLCVSDPCERMPALDYPIAGTEALEGEPSQGEVGGSTEADERIEGSQRENPFAVLSELLGQSDESLDGKKSDREK